MEHRRVMRRDPRRAMEKLRSQREALRSRLQGRLTKGRLKQRRPARPRKDNRRRWGMVLLIAILLLLWLLMPDCSENPPPAAASVPAPVQLVPAVEPQLPEPPPPRLPRRDRPAYDTPAPDALPWVSSFRMQVAARSPRLAQCFEGVQRPGRLKWTAAVEPVSGTVSAHTLEPMLQSDALSQLQRECVLSVLSDPPYRLPPGERSTPSRVGMVIEF